MSRAQKRRGAKKSRDATRSSRSYALRRRRRARVIAIVLVVGLIAGLALLAGLDTTEGAETLGAQKQAPDEVAAACGGEHPPRARAQRYEAPPAPGLAAGVDYAAVVHTSCGDIKLDLLENKAPVSVNNFVFLARQGFYDGLTWHRVERNSVIQAGDPNGQNGTPPDGPGYTITDAVPEKAREYVYGVVGMANAGRPGTGGSQFFIVVHDFEGALEGDPEPAGYASLYTIFGKVDESSYGVLERIAKQQTKGGTDPVESVEPKAPVYITSIDITQA